MNYFVVDTSFQMLCAIEARTAMGSGDTNRLYIEARGSSEGRELNLQQIVALDDGGWASIDVSTYPRYRGTRRSFARALNLLKLRFKYGSGQCCFAGLYSERWARRIANLLSGGRLVRLDDGVASILALRNLRAGGLNRFRAPVAFSMFHMPGDEPAIQPNHFGVLRGKAVVGHMDTSLLWLVGGAYAESGVLTVEREVAIYLALAASAQGGKAIYLPHRADQEEKLSRLRAHCIEVAAFGPTFETRLLSAMIRPARICGIGSTALLTARLLCPEIEVCAVHLSPSPNEAYEAFAEQAEAMGLDIIPEDHAISAPVATARS